MYNATELLRAGLTSRGASIVGFADLSSTPAEKRFQMPYGIAVAVAMTPEVVKSISRMPSKEYYDEYHRLNDLLDVLASYGAGVLASFGYKAIAQTTGFVKEYETDVSSRFPHKTVATRSGIGWIGKSALLVTEEYGAAVRISSILTDAPLKAGEAIDSSRCGACVCCVAACPGNAILGKNWSVELEREEIFDAARCRRTARARAREALGIEITHCGKCIEVCPFTRKYINNVVPWGGKR